MDLQRIFIQDLEFRAEVENEKRLILGYASLYNSPSREVKIMRNGIDEILFERIDPGAFETTDFSGCIFNVEHRNEKLVGRAGRNLSIQPNAKGIFFRLEIPQDSEASTEQSDLYKNTTQGLYRGCSFAFPPQMIESELIRENGKLVHLIKRVGRVDDLTVTSNPAYPETWLAKRALPDENIQEEVKDKEVIEESPDLEILKLDIDILELE